jgi:hypothetical protein
MIPGRGDIFRCLVSKSSDAFPHLEASGVSKSGGGLPELRRGWREFDGNFSSQVRRRPQARHVAWLERGLSPIGGQKKFLSDLDARGQNQQPAVSAHLKGYGFLEKGLLIASMAGDKNWPRSFNASTAAAIGAGAGANPRSACAQVFLESPGPPYDRNDM